MPTKGKDAPAAKPAPDPKPGPKARPSEPNLAVLEPGEPKRRPSEPNLAAVPRTRPSEPNLAVLARPDEPKRRPSEPNLAAFAKPGTKRSSEPNLAVAAKPVESGLAKRSSEPDLAVVAKPPKAEPNAKGRPSELAIAVDPRLKADAKKPVEKPKKPEPKKPTKGELPAEWRALVGKPLTCTWRRSSGHPIDVIDWAAFPERAAWLDEVFNGCDPAKHFTGLINRKGPHVEWTSTPMLPVALVGQNGGEGHLEAVLLIDTAMADSPIYAIEVDGTAVPAKKPQQIAANLAAIKIEIAKPGPKPKLDFDAARPKIVSGKIDNDAKKILQKLSGDRDAGAAFLQDHIVKKPRLPEGRDPRWIEALRDELAKSIVLASEALKTETHWLAGSLASFGEPAIPALVAALETALKSYPKHSLDYGVQPVLLALDYLKSDAGIATALAILAKAKSPETSYAIPPVLEYLKTRTGDPRVAPVIKKFYKKAAPKKPMHYIADLDAIAKQLDL